MTENEFRAVVHTNIRRYRNYRKWTQAEFAEKLGISINFLSDIENGKKWISPASIVKFASVLNIEPYELFKPADIQPPSTLTLLDRYNNDVLQAVSGSLEQVYNYYNSFVSSEIKKIAIKKDSKKRNNKIK